MLRCKSFGFNRIRLGLVTGMLLAAGVLLWQTSTPLSATDKDIPKKPASTPAQPPSSPPSAPNNPAKPNQGFTYHHDVVSEVPWSIHVVKVDRSRSDLCLIPVLARITNFGLAMVSQIVKSVPPEWGRPMAAINGDYFFSVPNFYGEPMGLTIRDGEVLSSPGKDRACMWMDDKGNAYLTNFVTEFVVTWPNGVSIPVGLNEPRPPGTSVLYTSTVGDSTFQLGGLEVVLERNGKDPWLPLRLGQVLNARVKKINTEGKTPLSPDYLVFSMSPQVARQAPKIEVGQILKVNMATTPLVTNAVMAIGGGPSLVREGKPRPFEGLQLRHPRVAIGWNKTHFFMVVVDGRQAGLSVGMTLAELANYMIKLGCEYAMNLDGGGSTTMWVMGQVMNSPSLGHERPSANALVLVRRAPKS